MKNDIAIADGDAEFLADLGGFKLQKLAHHENAGGVFGQVFQAGVENVPETLLPEGFFRVAPIVRAVSR